MFVKIGCLEQNGCLAWQGDKSQIFKTDNKDVTNFVYSSNLFKMVREAQNGK